MARKSVSDKVNSAVAAALAAAKEAEAAAAPKKVWTGKASFAVTGLFMADAQINFVESQFHGNEISLVTIRPSTMPADAKLECAAITRREACSVMSENEITAILGAAGTLDYYGLGIIDGEPCQWLHLAKDPALKVADCDWIGAVSTNLWAERADADGVLRFTTPLTGKIVNEISLPKDWYPGWMELKMAEGRLYVEQMHADGPLTKDEKTGKWYNKNESYRKLFHRHLGYMISGHGYHLHTGSFVSRKDGKLQTRMARKAEQLRSRLAMTNEERRLDKRASLNKVIAKEQEYRQIKTGEALGVVDPVRKDAEGKPVATKTAVTIVVDGTPVDATTLKGTFQLHRSNGKFFKNVIVDGKKAYSLRDMQTWNNVNGFYLQTPISR